MWETWPNPVTLESLFGLALQPLASTEADEELWGSSMRSGYRQHRLWLCTSNSGPTIYVLEPASSILAFVLPLAGSSEALPQSSVLIMGDSFWLLPSGKSKILSNLWHQGMGWAVPSWG